jgi:hypothetical protein
MSGADERGPNVANGAERTPWFSGSLAGLPFPELLELLGTSLRSGQLALTVGRAPAARRKTIWLHEGHVTFAASDDAADHLGAVLWRRGFVPLDALERLFPAVTPARPLGQVLVDERLLTPAALYDGLVAQVREIVLGAFHEADGVFLFHPGAPSPASEVQLPERTRDLVAAGARRCSEVERLAGEVPDPDGPLVPAGPPPARGLETRAERLLACAAQRATARDAFHRSGLGFYEGMKVLAGLARSGLVRGRPAPVLERATPVATAAEEALALQPLETYRHALRRVFFRVAHATPAAHERLNSWFDRLAEPDRATFDGVRLGSDGDLDVERVLANVFAAGREQGPAARARALAALDAFLSFALFEAKNVLPRDDAERLARDVAGMQGRRLS